MEITAGLVKELREKTGAGIMDCKSALKESSGDLDGAITFLREKGLASAGKKAGRATSEGRIFSYIHGEGTVGVLLEVNCETDFVARNDDFSALLKDIAMHIAAMDPQYLDRESVPGDAIEKERDILRNQALESGKPEKIVDKIVDGKIGKYYENFCLVEQAFVKNPDQTIADLVTDAVAKLGENIKIGRFTRFKLGEGAEDKSNEEEAA